MVDEKHECFGEKEIVLIWTKASEDKGGESRGLFVVHFLENNLYKQAMCTNN